VGTGKTNARVAAGASRDEVTQDFTDGPAQ
jgi:hypothetical protein